MASSRTSKSPALTRVPLATLMSATTPPVGCWMVLTLDSTTRLPGTTTAPASGMKKNQPPPDLSYEPPNSPAPEILRLGRAAFHRFHGNDGGYHGAEEGGAGGVHDVGDERGLVGQSHVLQDSGAQFLKARGRSVDVA